MKKNFLLILLLFPSSLFAFWPLTYEFDGEKRSILNLISLRKTEEKFELILRPAFLIYRTDGKDGILNFPYPIGEFKKDKSYFFPIFLSTSEKEKEFHSFFLIFYGKENDETYGGFFPFFGEVKKRYGKDRITFFLWPIYGKSEYHGTTKRTILWPILSFKEGREEGYKFFPIYGTSRVEGVRESQFFFWPFFFRERRNLDTYDPYSSLIVFPFYMRAGNESKRLESYCFFLNLHCYSRSEERERSSFFWPIISVYRGEEQGISIFPLIRDVSSPTYEERGFLWPFLFHSRRKIEDKKESESVRFLLFSNFRKSEDRRSLSLWPVLDYEEKGKEKYLTIPLLFPIDIGEMKRIINPVFSLIEIREREGYSGLNILYGLYAYERWGDDYRRSLGFILQSEKREGKKSLRILSGIVEVNDDEVRILFFKFSRGRRDIQTEP